MNFQLLFPDTDIPVNYGSFLSTAEFGPAISAGDFVAAWKAATTELALTWRHAARKGDNQ